MIRMFRNSFKDFKTLYKKYVLFEIIHTIITSFLFVPIISFIVGRLLIKIGSRSLINGDVFKTAISYEGIIGLIFIATLFIVFIFIEYGVLIVISQKKYFNKDISILNSFITTLKKIPRMLSLGVLPITILLILLIPFIELPITNILAKDLDVPLYIRRTVINSKIDLAIYIIVLISLIYTFLRLIFTFHSIIIENKNTFSSMKRSLKLTDSGQVKIFLKLIFFNAIIFSSGFLFVSLFTFLANKLNVLIDNNYLEELFITFSSYITYIFLSLLVPTNVIFLTRLYYYRRINLSEEIEDSLITHENIKFKKIENKLYKLIYNRRYILIALLTISIIVTFSINYFFNKDTIYFGRDILVAAHRSNTVSTPENSISAIRDALNKEINFIEIDVQLTKDEEVVLYHDISLRRLAGLSESVSQLTYEDLSKIDIGAGYSNEYEGEKIPTLDKVLKEVKGKMNLIVELKSYGSKEELVEKTLEVIEENDMIENVYIQSFDNRLLKMVREKNKNIKIGQIMYIAAGDLSYLDVDFYTIEQNMLSNKIISHARSKNRQIWVYTVNSKKDIKEALKYDIDGLITDYPLTVKEIIEFSF
ncbi:glycerophosphoryl diester phosphodiesterase membrane domain-containing protein [Senegalia sp. (in: firmicutes)]|uniref:glycerophosphoryl diester phosphodiesterase membrane domain-containing protein n=2 Tax=Senegalia sp. (in: firmicutes) TaxID=1924098 RepID=UPI003F9C7AE0